MITYPANASCSCATGYALVSGSCIPSCNVPTTNGITTTQVTGNNGTINCTTTGYSGSVAYSCASQGSNATITGSCTPITCSITGIAGLSTPPSEVKYTSTSTPLTCNATGYYAGTVNYTCTTGTLSVTGSCTPITCTAPAGNGYLAQSNLSYGTNSFPCNYVGYSGSKNYTCSGGVATITGGTCGCSTGYTGFAGGICISNSYIYSVDNRQALVSPNYFDGMNGYKLVMQPDRNLVLYNSAGSPVWWSGIAQSSSLNHRLCIQSDGNLVVYDSSNNSCNGGTPVWWSDTSSSNAKMVVGYQGQIRIYSSDGNTLLRSWP